MKASELIEKLRAAINQWLRLGPCHLTAEAAELHAKALLSFTRRDND